jgi:long-chain acyl-CoA synthetase
VAVVNTIAEKRVSIFIAIPSMYAALAQMKRASRKDYESVELAISGGEPLPGAIARAFEERFGVTLYEGYGLTESSPVVCTNVPWGYRLGSIGRALPGIEVTAFDDDGNALPAGGTGELVIRGHCVMKGYHNKPEANAAAVRDGALWTGDVGHVDADGFIFITGRAKEMIIVGGENVYPIEIEAVLVEHPAVAEAAVIGIVDDVRGELPVAFVILKEGAAADETELRNFCRDRLAGFKVPRQVRIMEDLPRGPTGKILKRALKV